MTSERDRSITGAEERFDFSGGVSAFGADCDPCRALTSAGTGRSIVHGVRDDLFRVLRQLRKFAAGYEITERTAEFELRENGVNSLLQTENQFFFNSFSRLSPRR